MKSEMIIPCINAWILAIIAAAAPFLIVFNYGDKLSIDSFWGGFFLAVMVMVLIIFLADAIASRIKNKALWIIFLLLCPTVAQITYLILKKRILRTE